MRVSRNQPELSSRAIIPGVTSCCSPIHAAIRGKYALEIDADCVREGDYLMCPNHLDRPIFLFGTGWWKAHGGTFENNAQIDAYCYLCRRNIRIDTWSWRG